MKVVAFPGTCTAKIAAGFDNSNGNHIGEGWGEAPPPNTVEEMQTWVHAQIVDLKEKGNATMIMTTRSTQHTINKTLLRMGVGHSPWMDKNRHSDTQLRVWYVDLHRWNEDHIDRVDDEEE